MSSLTRMLTVLDLFSKEHLTLTADEIAQALQLSRTTCYRYTHELTTAGLLRHNNGQFSLGPRIIQWDRRLRESDPLIHTGKKVLQELSNAVGASGLISTLCNNEIINIYSTDDDQHQVLAYGRGASLPFLRSSSSKVILANLSRARLQRIWQKHQYDEDCQAIGSTWLSFWQNMQTIKKQSYWISHSEIDTCFTGIAAPVFLGKEGDVMGSMTLILQTRQLPLFDVNALGERLITACNAVSTRIDQL